MSTLANFERFRQHTADDVSAALLTLAAALTAGQADDKPLTVQEAAARLKVSPDTVYDLCASKKLAHHRIGGGRGSIRINPADLGPKTIPLRKMV